MKKLVAVILSVAMVLSLAACASKVTESKAPGMGLNTLNEVYKNGYEVSGTTIGENVFCQTATNNSGEEYILIVKVPEELMGDFEAIDFLSDDAQAQYLALIGDIELTEAVKSADLMPDKDSLDMYVGGTISEFEMGGAEINGYIGGDGKYTFFFNDDCCDYTVELEDDVKLEDYDDTDMFNAVIQDCKIKSIECTGITSVFIQNYMEQFLDPKEGSSPKEMGEAEASLEEINKAVGSNIKAAAGATEEKFSVIDGWVAQYIYKLDDYYYCVRSAADTTVDLTTDTFEEDPMVDEDGYVTTVISQTDDTYSARFVFNGYQYAYIVYASEGFDYMTFNTLQEEYKNAVCEYSDSSALVKLLGTYSSDDNYYMSAIPVSEKSVQVTTYTYDDEKTELWTMMVSENGGKLTYDKSKLEVYPRTSDGEITINEAGSGEIIVTGDTIIWENHVFK